MQNWEYKKLGDVCDIINGKNQKEVLDENGAYPIYGSGGVMGYANDFLCRENTIIIGRKGSINNPIFVEEKFWNVDTAFGLQSKENYLPKLLFYFCKGFDFTTHNKGTTIPSLVKSDLLQIPVPLPPLEEQKRIVKILDEKFAMLETVKANAKANLQNAKDLFQSQLTKAFSNTTWEKKRLGDVITVLTDFNANGGYAKLDSNVKMYDEPNYAIMVRTTDLERNDFEHGVKYVDQKAYEMLSKSKIYGNEIIMNKIGSAGKIYLMPCLNRPATLARNAFMMRFIDSIDVQFLFSYLSSPEGTTSIMKHVHGAVTKTITKDEVRSIQIPYPPLPEQKRIVEQLDSLCEKVRFLEEIYTKQLANCDELKQAFLAKAFNGEL
ncbi:MAG: restriction endonuclease subunit S [Treponema sp.]|nr:restriction endonuclease subunit S [Treponema sp.]